MQEILSQNDIKSLTNGAALIIESQPKEINMFNPPVVAVPYRVGDLKEAFVKAHHHHTIEAIKDRTGVEGMHYIFAKQAKAALELIKLRGWNDDDAVIFPTQLADFATATTQNPPEGLESFNQYYVANRFTLIPARDTTKLFPR